MKEVNVIIKGDEVLFLFDSEDVRRIAKELKKLGICGEEKVVLCG